MKMDKDFADFPQDTRSIFWNLGKRRKKRIIYVYMKFRTKNHPLKRMNYPVDKI